MNYQTLIKNKIAEDYWIGKLSGVKFHSLAGADAPAHREAAQFARLELPVPVQLADQVNRACKGNQAGIYKLFAAGLVILSWKCSGATDILLATPGFGLPQAPAVAGNLLFLRTQIREMTARELLKELNDQLNEAGKYQDFDHQAFLGRFLSNQLGEARDLLNVGFTYSGFNHSCEQFGALGLQFALREEADALVLAV
ncbi:MAG: hypothetical protein ICV83_11000, partial [Cytophagales bacterium]|nr:hypothetical protein [Cytophagales bacterium]